MNLILHIQMVIVKLTTPDTLGADKTFKLPNSDGSSNGYGHKW